MISIKQAHAFVDANTPQPVVELLPLDRVPGLVLAEDVHSPMASPSCTNSSMDGYALSWEGVFGSPDKSSNSSPRCIGESSAGQPYSGPADPRCCIHISTGAMLPDWCDTVVPVEDTARQGGDIYLTQTVRRGQFVRIEGSEYPAGELLLQRGERLDPSRIGLLASCGITEVPVCRAPRVALILTGSELVPYDRPAEKYQVRDSNGPMLAAAVTAAGGTLLSSFRAADSLEETIASLDEAQSGADVVLFSGGISVGEHDHVREAAGAAGYRELFWRVRQKPGKPLFFARKGQTLLFGLPGNPVSSYMNFIIYIYPLLSAMAGRRLEPEVITAVMKDGFNNSGDRPTHFRVRLEREGNFLPNASVIERQESFMRTSTTGGDGFISLDVGETVGKGAEVAVRLLPWRS